MGLNPIRTSSVKSWCWHCSDSYQSSFFSQHLSYSYCSHWNSQLHLTYQTSSCQSLLSYQTRFFSYQSKPVSHYLNCSRYTQLSSQQNPYHSNHSHPRSIWIKVLIQSHYGRSYSNSLYTIGLGLLQEWARPGMLGILGRKIFMLLAYGAVFAMISLRVCIASGRGGSVLLFVSSWKVVPA